MINFLDLIWNNALAFVFVICVIVFIHEMGHFLVARFYGIGVKTFSVGFGPEIWGWTGKQSATRYRLSLIPLGGYVAMYGEQHSEDENDDSRSFAARPPYARAAVVAAGPFANFVLAFVLIALYVLIQGVSSERINGVMIERIIEDSAAEQAGLRAGDEITAVNQQNIRNFGQIVQAVQQSDGKTIIFDITRENSSPQQLQITVIPQLRINDTNDSSIGENSAPASSYFIGVQSVPPEWIKVGLGQAIILGADSLIWITVENLKALGAIITQKSDNAELGGPIKIAVTTKTFAQNGFASLLFFIALLSINLGLINLLPIPILDGGHLVFILYEIIFRKPMPLMIKEKLLRFGFTFIMTLIIFVTINDVLSL
ncbi:MAG: RIP metalloprotease RseP [Alphaproteobacteria bacterium]|nr:RIP metalloprotease RseP [Alphaproteobacteria bacterium]